MIFVTVGTHEQQFNRLVEYMDKWAKCHNEKVIIQTGFSTYTPKNCLWQKLYPYQDMVKLVDEARIVITHGGPSSFIMPLQIGKVPIVVPRKRKYDEHVNNHQVEFCRAVVKKQGNIILNENIQKLGIIIEHYDEIVNDIKKIVTNNNESFCLKFSEIVEKLME